MAQREELTRFLKAARARISPSQVGLPSGERRRAQGLRREEVASLSGMSVTWYTWFEQGRDVHLSAQMLERLSTALKLNPHEREFLFALAQHRPPPLAMAADREIAPSVQHMLDSLDVPAQILTEEWTVIGWNRIVLKLFRDYTQIAPQDRNLFKILMLDEKYRADPEWYREMAKTLTARFKWDYSRATRVEVFDEIIAEMLERCDVFREFWSESEIVGHFVGTHSVPSELGPILVQYTSYVVEQTPSQRLMVFSPMGTEAVDKMRRIAASLPAAE